MHGILTTFTTTTTPASDLQAPFTDFANELQNIDGFISKAWLQKSASVVGGFYLFRDAEAVDAYLASDMVAGLQSNEAFSDFEVRQFNILEELSAITGVHAIA